MRIPCSVEILTLNSEKTLEKCLKSVRHFDDIIILDGNSTDGTIELAKKYGARIFSQTDAQEKEQKIADFSAVRNKGITHARHEWFLFIDSDEYLSEEAATEIQKIIEAGQKNNFFIFKLPRKYIVEGRLIGRSSMYPNYQMRFFYIPATQGFVKKIHERICIKPGYPVGTLENPEYVPMEDIAFLKNKWHDYSKIQIAARGITPRMFPAFFLNNFSTFLKYIIKYFLTYVRGSGIRMPFLYEWYNAYYHVWLIQAAAVALLRGRNNRIT